METAEVILEKKELLLIAAFRISDTQKFKSRGKVSFDEGLNRGHTYLTLYCRRGFYSDVKNKKIIMR